MLNLRVSLSHLLLSALALSTHLACSGKVTVSEADAQAIENPNPDGGVPFIPVGVETVAAATVSAGRLLPISCLPVDEAGNLYGGISGLATEVRFATEDALRRQADGSYLAQRAGALEVHCVVPSLGLTDESPAVVEITPGPAAETMAELDQDSIQAGDEVEVRCSGRDRFGNLIPGLDAEVLLTPRSEGTEIKGHDVTVRKAQAYEVVCDHPRAMPQPAELVVGPGPPEQIAIAVLPPLRAHFPGDIVNVTTNVQDRFGNPVPDLHVELSADAESDAERPQEDQFRFVQEGTHRITATLPDSALDGEPLRTSVEVLIDGSAPAIRCDYPQDGLMLEADAEGKVAFRGVVADPSGVERVEVNGEPVELDADKLGVELKTEYGVNFARIEATDTVGRTASRLCAFLVAPSWLGESEVARHAVSLSLPAAAFDDGDREDDLDSLSDLLHAALRSESLRDTVDGQLLEHPILKPSACDESILGGCILRSEVRYENVQIMGEPSVSVTLVADGIATDVTLRGLRLGLRARGHVAGIDYDSRGTVTIDSIRARAEFDSRLAGGRPNLSVRPDRVNVSASGVETDFKGTDGAIIDLISDLFNGSVRGLIADAVQGVVTDQVADVLSASLRSIDVAALSTELNIDKPFSDEAVSVDLALSFSALDTTEERMLLGIGTRVTTGASTGLPGLGAPLRGALNPLTATGELAVLAVHEALANQIMTALWRAGLFELDIDGAMIEGVPNKLRGHISTGLPPTVELVDGRARLSVGGVQLEVTHPELLDGKPIHGQVGARLSAALGFDGQRLKLGDFRLDEVKLAADSPELGATTPLADSLGTLFQDMLAPVLEEAFPEVAIPGLSLPAAAARFGLPEKASLGLRQPKLNIAPPRAVLSGQFGLR